MPKYRIQPDGDFCYWLLSIISASYSTLQFTTRVLDQRQAQIYSSVNQSRDPESDR